MIVKSMHSGFKSLLYILPVESQKIMEVFHCTIDLHGFQICHSMVSKKRRPLLYSKISCITFSMSIKYKSISYMFSEVFYNTVKITEYENLLLKYHKTTPKNP